MINTTLVVRVFKAMILGTGLLKCVGRSKSVHMSWQRAKYRMAMSKLKSTLEDMGAATLSSIPSSKERGYIEHGQSLTPDTQAGAFFVAPKCIKLTNRPGAAVN